MPKKKSPFDSGKFGADKPNYTLNTKDVEVISTVDPSDGKVSQAVVEGNEVRNFVDEDTGVMTRETRESKRFDAVGRKVSNNDIVAVSWSDQTHIPADRHGTCCNPYDLHDGERQVFLGYDGMMTELGNVLCSECLEYHGRRLRLARWIGLGGLLWKVDEL